MLWIEAKDKKKIFHNSIGDDFIRFLPKTLKCLPEDIKVWAVAEEAMPLLKHQMQINDDYIRVCERSGDTLGLSVLKKVNVDGQDGYELIESHSFLLIKPVRDWPYETKDGKLKFIGLM